MSPAGHTERPSSTLDQEAAAARPSARPGRVVLVLPAEDAAAPFRYRITEAVKACLAPHGVRVEAVTADTAHDRLSGYVRDARPDGVLVVTSHAGQPLPAALAEAGVPVILFGTPDEGVEIGHVDLAQREAGAMAAEHLLDRGCRFICTVSGPRAVSASQERLYGFREALARKGRPYVPCAEGDFTEHGGGRAIVRMLAAHPDVDGVGAANDLMARGVIAALRDSGRRVPEDVAVIGFEDGFEAPDVTTVRQPLGEMAAAAAALLRERIAAPEAATRSRIFAPELVVRAST